MDRQHSLNHGLERRGSMLRNSTANDIDESDDEDYALAAMGISDGFRPSDVASSQIAPSHERRTSNVHPFRENGVRVPPPRPSSISKPKYDSFALRHDGTMGPPAARNAAVASSSSAMPSRSSSVSTNIPWRTEGPYQGPTAPSHPYQIYPQESRLARTASIATTSTVPVQEIPYAGPSRPMHPYGMYPQNIAAETESADDGPVVPPVRVGFPGLSNNYQRRLGPDGEEIADIIGPDGHTEQLPPYSQYPDEAFARKNRPMVQVPISSAGGIGLATRDPEFASREDLNSQDSRLSSRSLTLADSGSQINTAVAVMSEKPPLRRWQKFAKGKVCGIIPAWALILAAAVLIIFGIVLGSVFAALKPKHSQTHPNADGDVPAQSVSPATMTTFDATFFTAVPTAILSLPTGVWGLPIASPATQQNGCLQNSEQSAAWTCQIQPALPYQLDVNFIPAADPLCDNEIRLNLGNNSGIGYLPYGAQPPLVTQNHVMNLVTDSQSPERGPAWFFQTPYDKLVVVPSGQLLTPSNSKRQSSYGPSSGAFMGRKGTAQPGQFPWICYWNGTFIETFIYVNQTTSRVASASSSTRTASQSAQSSGYSNPGTLNSYPRVIKVQERRVPSQYPSIPPYCVQQEVDEDGNITPLRNSTGQPVTIYLNETEPSTVSPISDRSVSFEQLEERDQYFRERDELSSCGCVWLST